MPAITLILRICACPDRNFGIELNALDAAGWRALVTTSSGMRVLPLVDRAITQAGQQSLVPTDCAALIEDQRRVQAMSSFGNQIALTQVFGILAQHQIHPVVLKGVRLAHIDYPDARLRPMRDIDLLVPPEVAERTQQLLIDTGDYEVGKWSKLYGMEHGHQLPDLLDKRTGVTLEVHHRLNARGWAQEPMLVQKVHDEAQELILSGRVVRVPSAHANFLHLVEHATLHHFFDNGPLTLADLHYAGAGDKIDWPSVVMEAEELGLSRALQLVAALARRHGATWVPDIIDTSDSSLSSHVDIAEEAISRDESEADQFAFMRRLSLRKGRLPGLFTAVRAALTPNPVSLGSMLGMQKTNPLRWLAYPAWLLARATKYQSARRLGTTTGGTAREVAMLEWLHCH